ncbi:unnamed protein product, partial [Rhizoctonia solani]
MFPLVTGFPLIPPGEHGLAAPSNTDAKLKAAAKLKKDSASLLQFSRQLRALGFHKEAFEASQIAADLCRKALGVHAIATKVATTKHVAELCACTKDEGVVNQALGAQYGDIPYQPLGPSLSTDVLPPEMPVQISYFMPLSWLLDSAPVVAPLDTSIYTQGDPIRRKSFGIKEGLATEEALEVQVPGTQYWSHIKMQPNIHSSLSSLLFKLNENISRLGLAMQLWMPSTLKKKSGLWTTRHGSAALYSNVTGMSGSAGLSVGVFKPLKAIP